MLQVVSGKKRTGMRETENWADAADYVRRMGMPDDTAVGEVHDDLND